MEDLRYTCMDSPIGELLLVAGDAGLRVIRFAGAAPRPEWKPDDGGILGEAARQLRAYFARELTEFDLRLDPRGTPFQLAVWSALCEIPFGRSASYGDVARRIGKASAVRAVGAANGQNPLPIVVPCHRVIGSDGSLTGYGGGLPIKEFLLRLEGVLEPRQLDLTSWRSPPASR
jgi:methylated-DNA-[protein]-cysteine S-methyltransferase